MCDKSVYAAEQVLGPAGTVRHSIRIPPSPRCSRGSSTSPHTSADPVHRRAQYHKLCLKCKQCGKLLEPRLLVDHDGQVRHLAVLLSWPQIGLTPSCPS